jgi:hypothetical protein
MHSQPQHCSRMSDEPRALAALRARNMTPRYTMDRRVGGPQSLSGL